MTGGVKIDRLVLELPGLDQEMARELATGIADGLAGAEIEGDYSALSVVLAPGAATEPERLASQIVQSLLQRIG